MDYREWRPAYEAILTAFGYDETADATARDVLAALVSAEDVLSLSDIDLAGEVAICGGAASLLDDLAVARAADRVVAASQAADVLRDADVPIDCLVTDLDKTPETATTVAAADIPVAVHAHGDNIPLLREFVPRFDAAAILPTTQTAPRPPVENYGGFTDGDRAAFLADAAGADRLRFPGWDFDDPGVDAAKRRKLRWAERLLRWLELRRGERFDLLDGRRSVIDLPWLDATDTASRDTGPDGSRADADGDGSRPE